MQYCMFLYNIIYVFESIKNSDDSLSIHLRYLELALITVRYRRNKFSDAKTLKKLANTTRRKKKSEIKLLVCMYKWHML